MKAIQRIDVSKMCSSGTIHPTNVQSLEKSGITMFLRCQAAMRIVDAISSMLVVTSPVVGSRLRRPNSSSATTSA
jgi:hypothetical protein